MAKRERDHQPERVIKPFPVPKPEKVPATPAPPRREKVPA